MPRLRALLFAVCFGTTGTAQALGPEAAPVTVGARGEERRLASVPA